MSACRVTAFSPYNNISIFFRKLINFHEAGSSWKPNNVSNSSQIIHFLWNLKAHYRIQKNPPKFPVLRQLNAGQNSPSPRSSKRSLPFKFSNHNALHCPCSSVAACCLLPLRYKHFLRILRSDILNLCLWEIKFECILVFMVYISFVYSHIYYMGIRAKMPEINIFRKYAW